MGESQVNQADKVHHGEDDGAGGGVLPDELVQQEAGRADYNQDEAADFKEISHLNVDYNMMWQVVPSDSNTDFILLNLA
jgi:hypothetical protein